MKNTLQKIDLIPDNSIVIGSGIFQVLGIRQSKDIDLIISQKAFDTLKESKKFLLTENHKGEALKRSKFEISSNWLVLGGTYKFEDLIKETTIIDGVRYINLNFIYKVKQYSVRTVNPPRTKDVNDVNLIEEYLNNYN